MQIAKNLLGIIGGRIAYLDQGAEIHFELEKYISYNKIPSRKARKLVRKIVGGSLVGNQKDYFKKLEEECGGSINYINYDLTGEIFTILNPKE